MKTILLLGCVLFLGACTTFQRWHDEGDLKKVSELLSQGKAGELASASQTPFILDGEIILLKDDLGTLWTQLVKSGFQLPGAVLVEGRKPADDFGTGLEVKAFFKKYLTPETRVLEARLPSGDRYLFLIDSGGWGRFKILGWKGPFR